MHGRTWVGLAIAAGSLVALHCSSDEKSEGKKPGSGASPRTGGPGQPPVRDDGAPAAKGDGIVLAMTKMWVGESDRDFKMDPDAWKMFGHNIDGIVSKEGDENHCKPKEFGFPEEIQPDGPNGIDNSFGKNVLYKLSSIAKNVSYGITRAIDLGQVTFLIDLRNYGPARSQNDVDTGLYGGGFRLFDGAVPGTITDASADALTDAGLVILPDGNIVDPVCQFCEPPTWAPGEKWPVVYETVENGDIGQPKLRFQDAYVVDGTYVALPEGDLLLSVPLRGVSLDLVIKVPAISFEITGEGDDLRVVNGTISGVLEAEAMFETFRKAAGAIDPSFCRPIGLLEKPLLQSADILLDGTQDPGKECDGVSFGMGFEARPMTLGELTDPSPPAKEVCP